MTDEQWERVLSAQWVINTVLKKQGLSGDEDMREEALEYMIKCMERYDEGSGAKFESYAYKSVYLYVKRRTKATKLMEERISPEQETPSELSDIDELLDESTLLTELKSKSTEREWQILKMRAEGYTQKEIANKLKMSVASMKKLWCDYKRRIKWNS